MLGNRSVLTQKNGILTKREIIEALSNVADDAPIHLCVDELRGGAGIVYVRDGKVFIADEGV